MTTVIFCLDDSKGMLFNHRRLSRDAMVLEDIKTYISGALLITAFSEKLVAASGLPYEIFEAFIAPGNSDATYFIEDISVKEQLAKIDRIVLYWWNRKYPSDVRLDFEPAECGYKLCDVQEFAGKSHEKITREVWKK